MGSQLPAVATPAPPSHTLHCPQPFCCRASQSGATNTTCTHPKSHAHTSHSICARAGSSPANSLPLNSLLRRSRCSTSWKRLTYSSTLLCGEKKTEGRQPRAVFYFVNSAWRCPAAIGAPHGQLHPLYAAACVAAGSAAGQLEGRAGTSTPTLAAGMHVPVARALPPCSRLAASKPAATRAQHAAPAAAHLCVPQHAARLLRLEEEAPHWVVQHIGHLKGAHHLRSHVQPANSKHAHHLWSHVLAQDDPLEGRLAPVMTSSKRAPKSQAHRTAPRSQAEAAPTGGAHLHHVARLRAALQRLKRAVQHLGREPPVLCRCTRGSSEGPG